MNLKDFLPYVLATDIPETYQAIVDLIGIDAFLKLCQYSMGNELYFPVPDTVFRNARKRMILQEYNGCNIKGLAQKYRITTSQVRNIVKGLNSKKYG